MNEIEMAMENVQSDCTTDQEGMQVKMDKNLWAADRKHIRAGYALLREALNEFELVYHKDNIMAHAVRVLGAIEDTLYEFVNTRKEAK